MSARNLLRGLLPQALLAAALMMAGGAARADDPYRLFAGDVVAMRVAGVPDLAQKADVQLDGSISLPEVGEVPAAGRTLGEVRESIRTAIASRLVPVYSADGQQHLRAVTRDQVSAWIEAYRPVFVSGDVQRSGEFTFRPGLTVGQAIAAAGGVARTPAAALPVANAAGLEADYRGAWYALAAAEARVWRLRTELGEDIPFDPSALPPAPQRGSALDDILNVEKDMRRTRQLADDRQRAFLERSIQQIDQQIAVMKQELAVQKQAEDADAADLKKAVALNAKGLFTDARMSDLRRAAMDSSTLRLKTESNLMQFERSSTEVKHELESLDDKRHLSLLDELQQARIKRAAARARLNQLVSQLQMAGMAVPDAGPKTISATVVRTGEAAPIQAAPDFRLLPGDIVQVALGADTQAPGAAGAAPAPATPAPQDPSAMIGVSSSDPSRRAAASNG